MDVGCRREVSIDAQRSPNLAVAHPIRCRDVAPLTLLTSVAAVTTAQAMKDETD